MQKVNYVEIKRDKYILRGLYTRGEEEKALLVMFHGFTGHMNENGYYFKKLTNLLVPHGISTIRFDFMGSGISDGDFNEMTFATECEDAKAIINYCLENYHTKLYALGFSFGGAVLAYVISEFKDKIEKIVLSSPAGNMDKSCEEYKKLPAGRWYDESNIDMGGYLMSKAFIYSFDGIDLYQNIHEFKKPALIVHGELDQAVPIEYGRRYAELLDDVKFVEIKGSSHCYTKMEYRAIAYKEIVDFLK